MPSVQPAASPSATAPPAAAVAPVTPFAVRPWRVGVVAHMLSAAAAWGIAVAAGYVVYQRTGSAVAVAVLTVAARVPGILLNLHSGAIADALDVRVLTRWMTALQAVPAAALAVLAWDGELRTGEVYAGVAAISLLASVSGPCMQLEISATLPESIRRGGIALNNAAGYAAALLGAAGAGWLLKVDGPRFVLALGAVLALAVAATFARFDAPPRPRVPHRPVRHTVTRVPGLGWWLAGTAAVLAFALEPLSHLAPAIAARHGSSPHLLGLYVGAIAAGSAIGALIVRELEARQVPSLRVLPPVMAAAALLLLALAAWPSYGLALGTMVLVGVAWEVCALETLFALLPHAPERRVGLGVGIWGAATAAGALLGSLVLARVMDDIGVDAALSACAAAILLLALAAARRARHA
ncbi:MAG TPA: MFS transporter [Capillimicrobium sp.]|nr:MFS transporter [Capillimicrobium sp.]